MYLNTFAYAFLVILSIAVITYSLTKGKKGPLLYSFLCFQFIIIVWAFREIFLYSTFFWNAEYSILTAILHTTAYTIICFSGLTTLVFTLFYTDSVLVKRRKTLLTILIIFVAYFISGLVNNYHGIYSGATGIAKINFIINYSLGFISIVLMLIKTIRQKGYMKIQTLLLLLALGVAVFIGFRTDYDVYINRETFLAGYPAIHPFFLSISMALIVFTEYKYKFLNIMPVAVKEVFDNMNLGILVTDINNMILDSNQYIKNIFKEDLNIKKLKSMNILANQIEALTLKSENDLKVLKAMKDKNKFNFSGDLVTVKPDKTYYSISIKPVYAGRNEIIGRIITFNDITVYKNLLSEINLKNDELQDVNTELSAMNEQLKNYAGTIEELSAVKERNRIARDVHDTLGHTMTVLITLLKVSSITCETDPAATKKKLLEAHDIAKMGLRELRRSISGMTPEKLEDGNITGAIRHMISEFEVSGIKVDFVYDGVNEEILAYYTEVIFRICQEALTNSLRHGKAEHATIILKTSENFIKILATDDGIGCNEIKKGYGLSGMEQRVNEAGGNIQYGSDGEKGFNIYVEIPVKNSCSENPDKGEKRK
ncbi:MAG: histidine kinase [Bacillota bacterium]|nr:histidine kinase [Bacillota bacterium]